MTSNPSPQTVLRKEREARLLGWGFVIVLALLVFDIFARNVGPWQPFWQFYVTWEAASIFFTLIVTPIYWNKYISHGSDTAYSSVMLTADNLKIHLGLMILGSAVSLIAAGLLAFCIAFNQYQDTFNLEWMLVFEAGCLVLGVLFLVVAELMVVKAAPKALIKAREQLAVQNALLAMQTNVEGKVLVQTQIELWEKRAADYQDIADDIGKVLAFSDAPIVMAFSVIFALVCGNALGLLGDGGVLIPPFIAGAVGFQLLYSNFVFYLEANGAFPDWAKNRIPALDFVNPMIQGYPANSDQRQARIANSAVEPKLEIEPDNDSDTTSV